MADAAPIVETERLVLGPHLEKDFAEVAAMWADPEVTRFIGGRPLAAEEVWGKFLRNIGHWRLLGFGYWLARERDSGRLVGQIGFSDFRRDIEPGFDGAPEMGWALAPWANGQGFATEAVRAAVAWGDAEWGPRRTVCIIAPEHRASIRVAEKCGYRPFARAIYHEAPTVIFER